MGNVREVLTGLEERLKGRPDKLQSAPGIYQFDLTGEGGGSYSLSISGTEISVQDGPAANPGVVMTMTAGDFIDLTTGKLNGVTAFMSGKLKVKGDMSLALKLQGLLS